MQLQQAKLFSINIVVLVVGFASALHLQSPESNHDGFLARLHRLQLNRPIESSSDFNSNPSISSIDAASESSAAHAVWNQIRQRQKQLQRLQNYFGPEAIASIDQLQFNKDVPSVSTFGKHVDMSSGSLNQMAYPIETVQHALLSSSKMPSSPYQLLTKNDDESIDKLRKYHFQDESGEESPFALKSPAQMNAFDQLLQETEAEKPKDSVADENLVKNRLEQLFANSNKYRTVGLDQQISNDQLAALLRHAPLEAILAQAQNEAVQQRRQLAEASQTGQQSKMIDASLTQQMPMKKQAETNQGEVESMQTDEQQPQHFKTQLKKVEISQQDGKQLRKEESYEQSVQVSPVTNQSGASSSSSSNAIDSIVSHDAEPSHIEQSSYQVRAPISVQLRNDPSAVGPTTRSITSKLTSFGDLYFLMLVVGCSMASIMSVVGAGICFYRFQQHHKATADVDYPAYGVIGPVSKPPISPGAQQPLQVDLKGSKGEVRKTNESLPTGEPIVSGGATSGAGVGSTDSSANDAPNGDRKLAQSAQMYHYQHQKQQMIASEKNTNGRNTSTSDVESEEENEEGDYTVYECPGLASTGEIEVTNPLFQHSP